VRGVAEVLLRGGLMLQDDLADLVRQYGEGDRLRDYVIGHGRVSEQQFAQALAEQHGLTFVDLGALTIDAEVVGLVPAALCRRRRVMPVARSGDRLTLAMVDPSDILAIDDVASVTGLIARPVVVTSSAMTQAIGRYLRSDTELSQISAALEQSAAPTEVSDAGEDPDAPVVRFVSLLIDQAITDRASDIHVEPTGSELKVRLRIDGVLHEMQSADRSIMDGVISRLKIMSDLDIAERRKPQDGRLSVKHEGRTVDLRVATLPTVWGEKVVMRILDHSAESRRLEDLHFSESNLRRYREAINRPFGMILATGPTGSGKSTTLYTTLAAIAKPELNAITVEDPVEYRLPGINQMQVNPRAGLTFDNALPPGPVHAAHERRAQRGHPAHRDRRRALPRRHRPQRGGGAAARATALPALPRAVHPGPGGDRGGRVRRTPGPGAGPAPRRRLHVLLRHRLPRAGGPARGDDAQPGTGAPRRAPLAGRRPAQGRARPGHGAAPRGRLRQGARRHHDARGGTSCRKLTWTGSWPRRRAVAPPTSTSWPAPPRWCGSTACSRRCRAGRSRCDRPGWRRT